MHLSVVGGATANQSASLLADAETDRWTQLKMQRGEGGEIYLVYISTFAL